MNRQLIERMINNTRSKELSISTAKEQTKSIICPYCGKMGVFVSPVPSIVIKDRLSERGLYKFGLWVCPNPECKLIVFTIDDLIFEETLIFPYKAYF